MIIRRPPRSTLFPYTTLFRSMNFFVVVGPKENTYIRVRDHDLFFSPANGKAVVKSAKDAVPLRITKVGPAPGIFTLQDRKSTRLNSSHSQNSYAVFCLKKKIK